MSTRARLAFFGLLAALAAAPGRAQELSASSFSPVDAHKLLRSHCVACHQGRSPAGGFNAAKLTAPDSLRVEPKLWSTAALRIREGDMPPKKAPALPPEQREQLVAWVDASLKAAACMDGITAPPAPMRRLNRAEYAATIRDLLNVHFNAGHALPADGAGGEGFDNAAETLFLSPIHAEKYLEAARQALEYGAKDPKSRAAFLIAEPNAQVYPEQAARTVLDAFLPRAFRRPVKPEETERYAALFRRARQKGESFDGAILYALTGVLVSPHFLFRVAEVNPHYEMASRLSYFLWGSMPDATLFELAAQGRLQDPATLDAQVERMLKDAKAREFAENFVEQWLGTRELGRDIKPDPALFSQYYDAELQSAIRYEPILFFQEILAANESVLNLLDSRFTILTNKLHRHYGLTGKEKLSQQPKRVELPEGSPRGGVLGMAAVLAVSSYPQRTSPVLRGKWVLEAVLGTPPPPPPPNVPELKDEHGGATPATLRERLMQHRQNPTCATCHNRIDPLGFGLENYDVLGRWRTEEAGKPVDSRGELPDGTTFDGPAQLKTILLRKKTQFVRNLTSKLLGYALNRGLTFADQCTVDQIVQRLEQDDYRAQTLIREIVRSAPFRHQPGATTP